MNTQTIIFITGAAILGSVLGILYFYQIVLKKRKKHLIQLSEDKLTDEIINLKIQLKVLYSLGPIVILLIWILGFDNYRQLDKHLEGSNLINKAQEVDALIKKLRNEKYLTSKDLTSSLDKYYIEEHAEKDIEQQIKYSENDIKEYIDDVLRKYYTSIKTEEKINLIVKGKLKDYYVSNEVEKLLHEKLDNKSFETRLKDYYLTTKIDELLQNKVDNKTFDTKLKEYYNSTRTDELLQAKVDNKTFDTRLKDYYLITKVDELLQSKVDNKAFETRFKDYYLAIKVDELLQQKLDHKTFESRMKNYYLSKAIDERFQKKNNGQ